MEFTKEDFEENEALLADRRMGVSAVAVVLSILLALFLIFACSQSHAGEIWKVTAYCPCKKCCGRNAQGITASGKVAKHGMVACNWLPFGTKLRIKGMAGIYVVEDRGAKSLFGSKTNPIRHLDIYMDCHAKALKFGVKHLEVEVIK